MRVATVGLISPTSGFTEEEQRLRHDFYARYLPSDVEIVQVNMPDGPEFLDRGEHFGDAAKAAERFYRDLDASRFDVIVATGAIDPALPRVRELAPGPVVAPGEASMYLASIVGRPLSIVTVDEHAVRAAEPFIAQTRAKPEIVSVRSMDVPVRQIVQDRARGAEALEREIRLAVSQDGAQAVYLGSMTLGTLGVAQRLREELRIPIFDPIRIVARAALELLVALGRHTGAP